MHFPGALYNRCEHSGDRRLQCLKFKWSITKNQGTTISQLKPPSPTLKKPTCGLFQYRISKTEIRSAFQSGKNSIANLVHTADTIYFHIVQLA